MLKLALLAPAMESNSMIKNSPLDFLLLENNSSDALFGETDTNEVFLPDNGGGMDEFEGDEGDESPEHEAGESEDEETGEELTTLSQELDELKDKITELKSKYPEDTNDDIAKALDDATSAIDLAVHHLGDIGEDLGNGSEDPDEDNVEFSGSASPDVAGAMFDAADKASAKSEGGYEANLGEARIDPIDDAEPLESAANVPTDDEFGQANAEMDLDTISNIRSLSDRQKEVLASYLRHDGNWRLMAAEFKVEPERMKRIFDRTVRTIVRFGGGKLVPQASPKYQG